MLPIGFYTSKSDSSPPTLPPVSPSLLAPIFRASFISSLALACSIFFLKTLLVSGGRKQGGK